MSKTAEYYTDIFMEILSAEASFDASFVDGRWELRGHHDICRMAAMAKMQKANKMLLEACGLTEAFEDFKKNLEFERRKRDDKVRAD